MKNNFRGAATDRTPGKIQPSTPTAAKSRSKTPVRQNVTVTAAVPKKIAQEYQRPLTAKGPSKKGQRTQLLHSAFKDVSLQVFVEIARIKKPQRAALITGQLLASFVIIMRDILTANPVDQNINMDWPQI